MKLLIQSVLILLVFTVLTGIVYPLFITLIGQTVFKYQADGSLAKKDGKVIGSMLIGQSFTNDSYFIGRLSECNYDATNSGAYNYGPSSSNLINMVFSQIKTVMQDNGIAAGTPIPPDMVTSSASGLDPDISAGNAFIQAKRISTIRKIPLEKITKLISNTMDSRVLGFWGVDKVNVLKLNMALDSL